MYPESAHSGKTPASELAHYIPRARAVENAVFLAMANWVGPGRRSDIRRPVTVDIDIHRRGAKK
jgi:hypothetical protein